MDTKAIYWGNELIRKGSTPCAWLRDLLGTLDPVLRGGCSESAAQTVAQQLLADPRYGGLLNPASEAHQRLKKWVDGLHASLEQDGDALSNRPSLTLPLLLRELSEAASRDGGLKGFDPIGVVPHQPPALTGWLKDLSAQGRQAYQLEREAGHARPADWVPRQSAWGGGAVAPEAQSVELPIYFVSQRSGLNGWLRVWLWPCPGAQLTPLPSVVQRSMPLAQSWVDGFAQAHVWLLSKMRGQGGEGRAGFASHPIGRREDNHPDTWPPTNHRNNGLIFGSLI